MVHHPSVYADLLGKKIREHGVKCWLINTGWTGGPFGEGKRIKISYTRRMLNAALNGELDDVPVYVDPYFNLSVPTSVNGVPVEAMNPRNTWTDKSKYDETAKKLVKMFHENFKTFEADTSEEIKKAGPSKIY